MCSAKCLLAILAIIFPPLPVWITRGLCSADSIINIALSCLGFVPGMLHAWYIIATTPDQDDLTSYQRISDEDLEQGRHNNGVSVYYVSHAPQQRQPQYQQPQPQAGNYGTINSSAQQGDQGTSRGEVPPTYSEAIKGDNKVQTH